MHRFFGQVVGCKSVREQLGWFDPENIGMAEVDHTYKNGDTVSDHYANVDRGLGLLLLELLPQRFMV